MEERNEKKKSIDSIDNGSTAGLFVFRDFCGKHEGRKRRGCD